MSCPCCIRSNNPFGFLASSLHPTSRRHRWQSNQLSAAQAAQTTAVRAARDSSAEELSASGLAAAPQPVTVSPPALPLPAASGSAPTVAGPSSASDRSSPPAMPSSAPHLSDNEPHRVHHPILDPINDATKWWVSAAAFTVLITRHDAYVAWCLTGSIVAAFNNKVLKKVINQARPGSARKADPGMPSSHAQSLAFLTTYAIIGILAAVEDPSLAAAAAAGTAGVGAFLAWLRVRLGFHTTDQVAVGVLVGISSASLWHLLGTRYAFPYLSDNPEAVAYLWGATGAAVAVFGARTVLGWFSEREERRRMAGGQMGGKKAK